MRRAGREVSYEVYDVTCLYVHQDTTRGEVESVLYSETCVTRSEGSLPTQGVRPIVSLVIK